MTVINIWVGGYTPTMGGTAKGISLLRWDTDGTGLELLDTTPTSSPSFLATGRGELRGGLRGGLRYATDEFGTGEAGRIEVFRHGPGLSLEPLGGQPTSAGPPAMSALPAIASTSRTMVTAPSMSSPSLPTV